MLNPETEEVTLFDLSEGRLDIRQIILDKTGNIWFTDAQRGQLGQFDTQTKRTIFYALPQELSHPHALDSDRSGRIWIAGQANHHIAQFDPETRRLILYELPISAFDIENIDVDFTGAIWVTDPAGNRIGRITTGS